MAKNYLSPSAFDAMKAELRGLLEKERPQVVEQVSAAAALGDRSENAEYLYGKKRLREIDRRVRFLQSRLADVEVIAENDLSNHEVRFGTWVKVQSSLGSEKTFQLVGPDEFDTSGEKITLQSPLGRSILGKKLGESVIIQSPKGEITYTILALSRTKP
ncbi:MAG: transcription elongation factor GreB, partial [bacterium]